MRPPLSVQSLRYGQCSPRTSTPSPTSRRLRDRRRPQRRCPRAPLRRPRRPSSRRPGVRWPEPTGHHREDSRPQSVGQSASCRAGGSTWCNTLPGRRGQHVQACRRMPPLPAQPAHTAGPSGALPGRATRGRAGRFRALARTWGSEVGVQWSRLRGRGGRGDRGSGIEEDAEVEVQTSCNRTDVSSRCARRSSGTGPAMIRSVSTETGQMPASARWPTLSAVARPTTRRE